MPLATALRSVVESNRDDWPLDVYILTTDMHEDSQKRVINSLPRGSASIRWIVVNLSSFHRFLNETYSSEMIHARFMISQILPDSVRRILYLDADVLVLASLRPLWESDLGDKVLGAVLDGLDAALKSGEPRWNQVPRVGDYFNSGVLLIDIEKWRAHRIPDRAIAYLDTHPSSPFPDQDALNVACNGLWKPLDPKWNHQSHVTRSFKDMEPAERPAIVHFVTEMKPWKQGSLSSYVSMYDAFRSRTCYARTFWERGRDGLRVARSRLGNLSQNRLVDRPLWSRRERSGRS